MYHGLKYHRFFSIADSDSGESGRCCIIGKLYKTKRYPRYKPDNTDEPSPSFQELSCKSSSTGFVIVFPKNHTNKPERYASPNCYYDRNWYEREKTPHTYPRS